MADFMQENQIHTNQQLCFRSRHSYLSQLIHHVHQIIVALNEGKDVGVTVKKAFDKVDHKFSIRKYFNVGIRGRLRYSHYIENTRYH